MNTPAFLRECRPGKKSPPPLAAGIFFCMFACCLASAGHSQYIVYENFEGSFPPAGWTISGSPEQSSTQKHSGSYSVRFNAGGDELITPLLGSPGTMTYWMYATAGESCFNIDYSHSLSGPWTPLPGSPTTTDYGETFKQETFDLTGYSDIYIRFSRCGNKTYYLDDVVVEEISPWAMFRYDARRTGKCARGGPSIPYLKWSYEAGNYTPSSPALSEIDTLYIGCYDYNLYSIDSSGSLIWSYATSGIISSSPAVSTETVYIGSDDNNIYAIVHTGALSWSYDLGFPISQSPALSATETIYIGSFKSLLAINSAGSLIWSFAAWPGYNASPTLDSDKVYQGSQNNRIYALWQNGSFYWSYAAADDFLASAALSATGTVYIGSTDHNLYSITSTGSLLWSYSTGGEVASSMAVSTDTVYVGSNDNNLYSLWQNGYLYWSFENYSEWMASPAVSATDTVYVGAYGFGILYSINSNGTLQWSYESSPAKSSVALGTDTAYVGSGSTQGIIYAFSEPIATATPSEPTPTPTPITNFYVSTSTGSDVTGDGSMGNPWKTIRKGLDSVTGVPAWPVTLHVAEGTYPESELDMKEYVSVYGGYDPATWARDIDTYETIVDAAGGEDIFWGEDHATLDGLTIQNALKDGVFCWSSSPTISHCMFLNCGLAGVSTAAGAYIAANIFIGNEHAVFGGSNPGFTTTIVNNLMLSASGAGPSGVSSVSNNFACINNTIDNNEYGITIQRGSGDPNPTALIQNNSITRNWGDGGGGIYLSESADYGIDPSLITVKYNDVWNNLPNYAGAATPGEGDISKDPLYIAPLPQHMSARGGSAGETAISRDKMLAALAAEESIKGRAREAYRRAGEAASSGTARLSTDRAEPDGFDYRLMDDSPCANAGIDAGAPSDDLDGNHRPAGKRVDIGCYECLTCGEGSDFQPLDVILLYQEFYPGDLFEIYVQFWDTILDWDGYLVIAGNGKVWSVLGGNRLKPGIHPIVKNALEIHQFFGVKVFSLQVPYGVEGSYKVYGAILPTGTPPTLANAYGKFSQIDIEPCQVLRKTGGASRRVSLLHRLFSIFGFLP